MTKKTFVIKENGQTLSASEWNELTGYVNEAVDAINSVNTSDSGNNNSNSGLVTVTSKGNTQISSAKNINFEPAFDETTNTYGDISFKPGDDIEFLSSHRPADKQDEVSLKVHNDDKQPVKLQVNASEMTLTTKDKTGDDANVFDINVNSGKNSKGYLKVRAQAIDLRCEDHGGIALQPKGYDGESTPHMNKIKFEHGGGDGLEFGTFNPEHTSLFTNDYRFKKDGIIRLSSRTPVARATDGSDSKYDASDDTTHYTYTKQSDDFYDVIDQNDPTCTWEDIVKYISWAKANNQGPWVN